MEECVVGTHFYKAIRFWLSDYHILYSHNTTKAVFLLLPRFTTDVTSSKLKGFRKRFIQESRRSRNCNGDMPIKTAIYM